MDVFGFSERRKHGKGALEQDHVLPRLLLHGLKCGGAEGVGELLSILFLFASQRFKAEFEIFGHDLLDGMAVEPDKLTQKTDGKKVRACFSLLLHNNLR